MNHRQVTHEEEMEVKNLPAEIIGSIVNVCPGFIMPTALFSRKGNILVISGTQQMIKNCF